MNDLKKFFSDLNFSVNDLLFLFASGITAFFYNIGKDFMCALDPSEVTASLWFTIFMFVLLLVSWGAYIFFESKKYNPPGIVVTVIFAFLLVIGIIGIACQPSHHSIDMLIGGSTDTFHIETTFPPLFYLVFICELTSILLFLYSAFFLFPKKFSNLNFIKAICFLAIIFLSITNVYSYITEGSRYLNFVKYIFNGFFSNHSGIYDYTVMSFFLHRNNYGMMLLFGMSTCLILHAMEKKKVYYFLSLFFFANSIFTFSKSTFIIAVAVLFIYTIYRLYLMAVGDPKKRKIFFGSLIAFVALVAVLVIVALASHGKVLRPIYSLITGFPTSRTIVSRSYIWSNTIQLLNQNPFYYFVGRGFGLLNCMLCPMNIVNSDSLLAFYSNMTFVNMLGKGGIPYLAAFLALIGYSAFVLLKNRKKSPEITFAIATGFFAFLVYSVLETNQYYFYGFVIFILIFDHALSVQQTATLQSQQ